ncbi:phage tail protein [Enterococcus rivorum]|uniref:Tail spike domain-containing protein n=1 Tax=Enterococcus rivorum TaxID=762845 RepID=A0A1E5KZE3_9ENTE|nr:phage tail protein [Enterococcus rivorum]MBP2099353.1 FtsZ-binding cell division protein ZapB [Enterococcus rivorum]OEH83218.1 hypothetical protein BCR26_10465 [Enterococcus rivorum]
MYRVTLYENADDKKGIVIHEPANFGNKLAEGHLELSLEGLGISTFDFSININSPAYRKAEPIVNLVTVADSTGQIFKGRIAKITNAMSGAGKFVEKILCEDQKAYLYDSTQKYFKPEILTVRQFLEKILIEHNLQVENHKKIHLGTVTVRDKKQVYRNTGYGKTAEVLKDQLLDQLGGYFNLRESKDTLYLDYLAEYGKESTTPLQIARNLKSASREIDISELATRVVPIGKDLENQSSIEKEGNFSRQKTTIEAVNAGKNYIEDTSLVKKFGVIQKNLELSHVEDKNTLKKRAEDYLREQRLMLVTWTAEVIELGLIDKRYEIIKLGNSYPVANPYLYEKEILQVIEKKIDILNPQKINVTIGTGKKTFSQYQLEYRGMKETINSLKTSVSSGMQTMDYLQTQTAILPEHEQLLTKQQQELTHQKQLLQTQSDTIQNQEITLVAQQEKIEELYTIVKEIQKK